MPAVADALAALAKGKTGNYLAFFPSYAYLQQVYEAFAARINTPSTQGANWHWRLAQPLPATLAGHIAELTTLYERVPERL